MGFQGMRKSTVLPNAQSRPPRATPASIARRRRPQHREFPAGYSLAGCSPAEPASASPATPAYVHRPVRHNQQLRGFHFLSPSASISRLRNQHTACHSRAPSRQSSETEHFRRGGDRMSGPVSARQRPRNPGPGFRASAQSHSPDWSGNDPAIAHAKFRYTGESRYPRGKWIPAFAGKARRGVRAEPTE